MPKKESNLPRLSKEQKNGSLLRLALLMKPYIGWMIVCILSVLIANAASLVKPALAAIIIDDFLENGKEQHGLYSLTGISLSYLVVELAGIAAGILQVRLITKISQNILHNMRGQIFRKIMHLPTRSLDKHGSGRLITRATNDVETVNEFYSDVFINLFSDVFLLVGILIFMFSMDPYLATVSLVGIPLIALLTFSIKKVIKENFKFIKKTIGQINGFIAENISGMRIVQAFNRQKDKYDEFNHLNKQYFRGTMTQVMLNTFLRPMMEVINNLVIALIIAFGYNRIAGGLLQVGVLYAFTTYVKQFFNPINDLADKYTTVQSALVSVDRIYEVLDEPNCEEPRAGTHGGEVIGEIEFRDVWFAYNDENWVLKGVSFHLSPGQKAAFVGATGVGKSTIISLISRYYTIQKGQILIDGIPVEDWKLEDLRAGISTVLQDVFLFTGHIRENIDMHSNLSDEAIEAALQTAQAADFIREIGGLDTPVAEQGLNFSTGQRQLLSFARAIASNPSVLVLDEATAHIDSNTEELVQKSIENISRGRTSIFIAHRLSTIKNCDVIFVMVDGNIKERGTHEELCALDGVYAGLLRAKDDSAIAVER